MSSGTTAAAAAADERTMTAKGKVPRARCYNIAAAGGFIINYGCRTINVTCTMASDALSSYPGSRVDGFFSRPDTSMKY